MSSSPNDFRRACLASLVIVLLAAFVYLPVRSHEFVAIDTALYLTGNAHVLAGLSMDGVAWAFTSFDAANWHPVTWLSHMLDVQLFGTHPAGHHAVNAALHALNSVLVFCVLKRMTDRFGASLAVALLFAVHPLHVESVAWIVERKDVLSAFFGLLALLAWTRYARAGSRAAWLAAFVSFALALMSKPMLVTLPCALLVFDAWPFDRWRRGLGALLLEKAPFFALSIASCWVTIAAQSAGRAIQDVHELPLGARFENAVASIAWYASKAAWPSDLSFSYPLAQSGVSVGAIVAGGLVLLGVSAVAIAQLRVRPWIGAGWAIFSGMLVPVIGLVQVGGQAHADRYAYLPILGLFVACVWTVAGIVDSISAKRTLTVAFCCVFALLARQRVGDWQDSETLARSALAVDPRNAVAHDLLGWTLVAKGREVEGLEHLHTSVALQPGDPDARRNLGRTLLARGQVDDAEQELRAVVALRPDDPRSLLELGSLLVMRGSFDEARACLAAVKKLAPRDAGAFIALGELFDKQGDTASAEREYREALARDPSNVRANVDLAGVLIPQSKFDEAALLLESAIAVDPRSPQVLQQRARIHIGRGNAELAARDLRAALNARPDWPLAQSDLAWILATASDPALRAPAEALTLATRAVESGNAERAAFLDVLAQALAANARFEEAIRVAQAAAQAARRDGDLQLAGWIDLRLAAYRAKSMDSATPHR